MAKQRSAQSVDINKIRLNDSNPRFIKDEKFAALVKSIRSFPQMLDLRPIVVNEEMVVLGGNMRLRACIEAGLKEVPVTIAVGLTEEQQREFIIKDNVGFGEWDWDALANDWDTQELIDWGLDLPVPTEPKDLSDQIQSTFKIEVECTSEREQEKLFNDLKNKGYECRILTL